MLKARNHVLEGYSHASQATWQSGFFFVQAADTQLGMMDYWGSNGKDGKQYPDISWEREVELCRQTVTILNRMKPRPAFFVVCGDLLDAFPDKWPDIRRAQEASLKEVYSGLDPAIPMICVCGNHDIGNSPTKETIEGYRQSFGDDYFSFWVGGVCFLVLNSQFYEDPSHVQDLYQEHESWLASSLEEARQSGAKHIVLFQHIPWFLRQPEEEKEYFNVEVNLRLKKLQEFHEAGVKKIFCGHYHRNAGGFYKGLEVVVTTAIGCQLGSDTNGMRIVAVSESGINHSFHPLSDFPTAVDVS